MTIKTRFKTTAELLSERCALHVLVDMLWKNGDYTREDVYELLSRILQQPQGVHISDLDHSEMLKVSLRIQRMLEQDGIAACRTCLHHGTERTTLGMWVCQETGKPFCYRYKNSELMLAPCERYTEARHAKILQSEEAVIFREENHADEHNGDTATGCRSQ